MKHFSFFLTLLLLTACTRDPESGPAPGVGQTPMQEFYIPGVFRIKLRETAAELDTRAFTRSGSGSGIAAFDRHRRAGQDRHNNLGPAVRDRYNPAEYRHERA